jgi:hypothetical protein
MKRQKKEMRERRHSLLEGESKESDGGGAFASDKGVCRDEPELVAGHRRQF